MALLPRSLVFCACEKVIISQDENNPTLVAVLNQLGITAVGEGDRLPEKAAAPMRWNIFSLWLKEPEDETAYEQVVRLLSPARAKLFESHTRFASSKVTQRITLRMDAFPLAGSGRYVLELFLRRPDEEITTEPLASYPIDVTVELQRETDSPESSSAKQPKTVA